MILSMLKGDNGHLRNDLLYIDNFSISLNIVMLCQKPLLVSIAVFDRSCMTQITQVGDLVSTTSFFLCTYISYTTALIWNVIKSLIISENYLNSSCLPTVDFNISEQFEMLGVTLSFHLLHMLVVVLLMKNQIT